MEQVSASFFVFFSEMAVFDHKLAVFHKLDFFIRVEGFNFPPFRAFKKVLNLEYKYLIRIKYPVLRAKKLIIFLTKCALPP
jgi:hypothetical protein